MCRQSAGKSSLTAIVFKVSIVLAVVLSLHLASGSCLSYGHACWGGHGKRSGEEAPFARTNVAVPSDDPDARAKWFLSKLITPLELRYYGKKETETTNGRSDVQDLLNEMEKDDGKSITDWNNGGETKSRDEDSVNALLQSVRYLDKRSVNH